MTTPALPPPQGCPDCSAPLTGAPRCPACGLTLVGHTAIRLWQVDQTIADLRVERLGLIQILRQPAVDGPSAAPGPAVFAAPAAAAPTSPREASERSVQNTLLALGVLLLAVSGVILAAVTYGRLGAGGRAATLFALTAAAATAAPRLHRRGLTASAETAAGVTLVLAALDAAGLRSLGVGADTAAPGYAGVCSALLSAGCLGYLRVVPVRVAVVGGLVLADAAPLLLLAGLDVPGGSAAVLLALLAVANTCVAGLAATRAASDSREGRVAARATDAARAAEGLAALLAAGAVIAGVVGACFGDPLASVALLAVAGLVAAAPHGRLGLGAGAVPLLAVAVWGRVQSGMPDHLEPLVPALVAVAALALMAPFPAVRRPALLAGALATVGVAFATQLQGCLEAVVGPLGWLGEPWSLPAGSAREVLSPQLAWAGSAVTAAVTAALAVVLLGAGRVHPGWVRGRLPAAVGGLGAVFLLPLALDVPYAVALAALLVLIAALTAVGLLRHPMALLAAAVLACPTLAWAAADRSATLVALALAAVLAGLTAARLRDPWAAAPAGLLAAAEVGAIGAAAGLSAPQVAGVLVLCVAALAAPAAVLHPRLSHGLEAAAAGSAGAAVLLAAGDAGWLAPVLAGLGLIALAVSVRRTRRPTAPVGALLLAASSWVRLAEAGVQAPEAYVLPIGLVALALGWLRRREQPGLSSWAAYSPGLSAVLVPSLLAVDAAGLGRPLLLGLGALVVVLVGARFRLQAHLVLGSIVLGLDAVHLLAPYAADLPRWLPLAAAGVVLVTVGVTYEERGRDLARLRERYAACG